jgi:glycerate 2-kinase
LGSRILNMAPLASHANAAGRKAVLEILEAGLQAADPYHNTKSFLRVENGRLVVGVPDMIPPGDPHTGEEVFDLSEVGRIYVFGAGKGVQRIALAIEEVLGDRLAGGHVIAKHGDDIILNRIGVTLGGHPVPDEYCVSGSQKILKLCQGMRRNDLVFTIGCNGVSSLLTCPAAGITIDEASEVTRMMQIERGVPTGDLNEIRNSIDMMKGGRATRAFQPAMAIHIMGVDPYPWKWITGANVWQHFLPDATTFAKAIAVLKKWDAWDAAPHSVCEHLLRGDPRDFTVSWAEFQTFNRHRFFGVMPHATSFIPTGMKKAAELGFKPYRLAGRISAEAKDAGYVVADIARSCERSGEPFEPPCALFSSGELLVTVGKETGVGGRNQEYTLAAALRLAGSESVVMAGVDTDGTDGPGGRFAEDQGGVLCLAGGIVDGHTLAEAKAQGVDLVQALKTHATSAALWQLKSGIAVSQNISVGDFDVTVIASRNDDSLDNK